MLEGDAEVARAVGLGVPGVLTDADDVLALDISKARHAEARALAAAAQDTRAAADRWWRLTTAPRTGIPILLGVIVGVFATLFIVGDLLARVLTAAWTAWISPAVIDIVTAVFGNGIVGRVVLWGVDGGILATLAVGIPYILTFYFILALVEDTGYMNAAAFLSDRVMHRIGLHGRAIIPLIAAGGCNVPAIIATRSLTNKRERTIAAVLSTLTPCSARTAVIIGAVAGVAGWQYAVLTYVVLIVVIILAGLGLNRLMPGDKGVLVMEMFPFRRPVLRQVARKTWRRFREFVWDAAPIILLGSMALGVLYETGWIWDIGTVLGPIVEGWLLLPRWPGSRWCSQYCARNSRSSCCSCSRRSPPAAPSRASPRSCRRRRSSPSRSSTRCTSRVSRRSRCWGASWAGGARRSSAPAPWCSRSSSAASSPASCR